MKYHGNSMCCRGYMAPEYALWGYLTYKADVYSFGVVALEIVAGKNNIKYRPNEKFVCLLDWVRLSFAFCFETYRQNHNMNPSCIFWNNPFNYKSPCFIFPWVQVGK